MLHLGLAHAGLAAVTIGAAGCATSPAGPDLPESAPSRVRIVFEAFDGDQELFTIGADGGSPLRLTDNLSDDVAPVPSPDGARIAFTSMRDGNAEIYLVDAGGTGLRRVTTNEGLDSEAQWSPDGQRLVHVRYGAAGSQIVVTELARASERVISSPGAVVAAPRWSPNGAEILWIERLSDRSGNLFVADADGGAARPLTRESGMRPTDPAWSPAGDAVVFAAERSDRVDLERLEFATGALTKLTDDEFVESRPLWAADGSQLLFHVLPARQGGRDLYVSRADGSDRRQLTSDFRDDYMASWLPGGHELVFVSERDGSAELYRLSLESGVTLRLTTNDTEEANPGAVTPPPDLAPHGLALEVRRVQRGRTHQEQEKE